MYSIFGWGYGQVKMYVLYVYVVFRVCTSYARVDLASAELCWSMHLETAGGELCCLDVYMGLY